MTNPAIMIAQINPIVGDVEGNKALLLAAYQEAVDQNADLLVAPELVTVGYPPEDLLLTPEIAKQYTQVARQIASVTTATGLVFGTPWYEAGALYNAAVFASDGRIQHIYFKTMLPNYGVFDEKRIFSPGNNVKIFEWKGQKLALMICEDVWYLENALALSRQHVDRVIAVNASPFEAGKLAQRRHVVAQFAQTARSPVVYVNMVGGQDDIVFDGASFIMDAAGYVTYQCPQFAAGVFKIPALLPEAPRAAIAPDAPLPEQLWNAMAMGLRDYVDKNGFQGVLLGLSGGIDSAVTAAVAVDALGASAVRGVLLPSPYTSQDSIDDALETASLLGIHTDTIPITPAMQIYQHALEPVFETITHPKSGSDLITVDWIEDPAVGGNIQARIRGQILMAISNKTGYMLLSTGNKSEIAVGYTTLYGDACGGYNVLKDLYKTGVYEVARWRNTQGKVIPLRSISKAPSAELKPDQKDSDQLPPYDILDMILEQHIEGRRTEAELVAEGFDAQMVARVVKLVKLAEYKRRQSCPGVKLSSMMFGRDRRFPLTNQT